MSRGYLYALTLSGLVNQHPETNTDGAHHKANFLFLIVRSGSYPARLSGSRGGDEGSPAQGICSCGFMDYVYRLFCAYIANGARHAGGKVFPSLDAADSIRCNGRWFSSGTKATALRSRRGLSCIYIIFV